MGTSVIVSTIKIKEKSSDGGGVNCMYMIMGCFFFCYFSKFSNVVIFTIKKNVVLGC